MSRLIVISNRVALPSRDKSAQGGLAIALMTALRERGGIWFGWNGKTTQNVPRRPTIDKFENIKFATFPLTGRDYTEYYKGYSNSTLWPLFHSQLHAFSYERRFYSGYRRVNRSFVDKLLPMIEEGDLIWVHDYHLFPLAHELRIAGIKNPIGFFIHIPFPPHELFRILPEYRQILEFLCDYDLVGVQTANDKRAFIECIEQMESGSSHKRGVVSAWGKQVRVQELPIGISVDEVVNMAERGRKSGQNRRLQASIMHDRELIIGVDRLDYSKGLPQRFRAFELLLERYPENLGKIEFIQIAAPSRTDVPEYQKIRIELDTLAGRINGKYAEYDWIPLHYLNKAYARATIMGFLSVSRVGLVTPLKDGMNLVAKEFVAAQDPSDPGVLVLSQMTGASLEMEDALIVNPYDIDAVVDAVQTALTLSLRERTKRWLKLMDCLKDFDVFDWSKTFIDMLAKTHTNVYLNQR